MSEEPDRRSSDHSDRRSSGVETTPPLLRVVRGDPTVEELAALVAVVASLGGPEDTAPRRTPEWNAPHRAVRIRYSHGPGGWRSSGLPH